MIGLAGYAHLLFFGIFVPIAAIRTKKLLETHPLPPRERYFIAALTQVAVMAVISLVVAWRESVPIFVPAVPPRNSVIAGAALLLFAVAFGWTQWRKAVAERKRVIALFMPMNDRERMFWVAASALAGFGEELTWRGVQTILLTRLTGNLLIAIAICIVMFSIAHAIQGWDSVGIIALFAAAFHGLVWLSGSLYVAIVVHFLYDLIAGFAYAHLAKKMGYPFDAIMSATPESRTSAEDPASSETQTT